MIDLCKQRDHLLYDINEGIIKEPPTSTGLQSPKGIDSLDESSSFINNSILQTDNEVNNDTIINNYAQSTANNTSLHFIAI